ncbi:MAG: hypothetical protein HYZ42_05035, partial [Bacteroidetes bacterium]|nr:hypothetical protein [Bacteroidota bacterium]
MAEYIAREMFPSNFNFESAGLYADENHIYQQFAIDCLNDEYHINLKRLTSKNTKEFDLNSFNKLYVLDKGIWNKLKSNKSLKGKLFCYHVDDPFEDNKSVYQSAFYQ